MAIWLGAIILLVGLAVFVFSQAGNLSETRKAIRAGLAEEESRAPFRTVQWYLLQESGDQAVTGRSAVAAWFSDITGRPKSWSTNPLRSVYSGQLSGRAGQQSVTMEYEALRRKVLALKENALQAQASAEQHNFADPVANSDAEAAIEAWRAAREHLDKASSNIRKPYNIAGQLIMLGLVLGALFAAGGYWMGARYMTFFKAFWGVYFLAVLAFLLAAQTDMKNIGFGYAAWAILMGLVISNTTGCPAWMKPALRTEYYIKTGLVLLGAEILFGKILTIGLPGLFVAWVVTPVVLVATFWFGQRILGIASKTLNITISADMSVCGVSAAIATAAACKARKEELTLAIGLSMVFTSIMMILLPAVIKALGIPEVLGGAWIGGTIDATGAVVAAGAFLGDRALNVAATIKMIQNILIGIVAFAVAVYWSVKVEKTGDARVGWSEIWRRFPKFILGFIGASVVFTTLYFVLGQDMGDALIDQGVIGSFSKNLRGWLFGLAFISIGLSTNFRALRTHFKGGKPLILYISGQAFNLLLTLLMAYLMFYVVFPEITEKI
jgi:uncharacterized membrane protein YadS